MKTSTGKRNEGNNNRAQYTVPAAPVGHPTHLGASSGTGDGQRHSRFYLSMLAKTRKILQIWSLVYYEYFILMFMHS